MQNDCFLLFNNPSPSVLIRKAFAKTITIQFSAIATVAVAAETAINSSARLNRFKSTPAFAGATGVNKKATTFYAGVMHNHGRVISNCARVTAINGCSNRVLRSCNNI